MEDYFEEAYHESDYDVVYEIQDNMDGSFVANTTDIAIAKSHHERGFYVDEHRIQRMRATNNVRSDLIITIEW